MHIRGKKTFNEIPLCAYRRQVCTRTLYDSRITRAHYTTHALLSRSDNCYNVIVCANRASMDIKLLKYQKKTSTWILLDLPENCEFVMPLNDTGFDTVPLGLVIDYTNVTETSTKLSGEKSNSPIPIIIIYNNEFHILPLFYDIDFPKLIFPMKIPLSIPPPPSKKSIIPTNQKVNICILLNIHNRNVF